MSSNIVFQSAWISFSNDENVPVTVDPNLGYTPQVIGLDCSLDEGTTIGIELKFDNNGLPIKGPYITQNFDTGVISVYKPNAYTYAGKFRITIYN